MTALRDPREMSDTELAVVLSICSRIEQKRSYVWKRYARPEQLPPPGSWVVWLYLGGRGVGKTRTGSETCRGWGSERPRQHIAVVAKTHREVLNICYEAPRAGLVAVVPPDEVINYLRGSGSVAMTMSNGSILRAFSAIDPEAMRGYAFDKVWLDEFAAYPVKTAQAVYDMAWFCMRESPFPQMLITTTPKPLPHVKKVVNRSHRQPTKVIMTRSSTWDNRANLSAEALAELEETYAGTRLGRQELEAEILEDVPGALWKLAWIEAGRVHPDDVPELLRSYVAIDPAETVSETSDETGIVVGGLGVDGDVFVLADRSAKVAGLAAAFRIWEAWIDFACEAVIIEGTSLWMLDTLELAWRELQKLGRVPPGNPPIKTAQPFANKKMRATPIAAVYEKVETSHVARIHHVGTFAKLEEQLTTWTPEEGDSPDRLDALVYLVGELLGSIARIATVASATAHVAEERRRRGIVGPRAGSVGVGWRPPKNR